MDTIGQFFGDFAVAMVSGVLVVMIVALSAAIWREGRGPGPFSVIVGSAVLGLVLAIISLALHDNTWLLGTAAVLTSGLIGAWIIALRPDRGR